MALGVRVLVGGSVVSADDTQHPEYLQLQDKLMSSQVPDS
jgi:hypothetical protein